MKMRSIAELAWRTITLLRHLPLHVVFIFTTPAFYQITHITHSNPHKKGEETYWPLPPGSANTNTTTVSDRD
jgi:hypothetical protein